MPQLIQQKAVITYVDEFYLWPSIGPKLIERLPIRDIVVNDIRLLQQKKIRALDLEWRVFDNSEFLKLRDISPFTVPKKFPFLNLYICKCDDVNTFQQIVKISLQKWLDIVNVVPYQQSLVVYVSEGNENKTKAVYDKIKGMVKKNCCKLSFDRKFEEKSWNEFFDLVKANVMEGFTQQLVHYSEELKKIDMHRGTQGWNFSKYCLIKESLARLYENMNMFSEAMVEYQEIEVAYQLNAFSGDSVADFNPDMNIIDLNTNKQYQQLILKGCISDFDFRHYILHKKILIHDFMNCPEEISKNVKAFLTTFNLDIHVELLVSWKTSMINSILTYLKKAVTSSHLSQQQVNQLQADYGELSHYQVTLIKSLLNENPKMEWKNTSFLFTETLNTRNNAMEFIETACLSAAFKYESIGMQRHAIKLKKELAICYQILEFHEDAIGYLNNLLSQKEIELPHKMRNDMLSSLLICFQTLNNSNEMAITTLRQLDKSLLHLQDTASMWKLVLEKSKSQITFPLLNIFHMPKVVFDSVAESNNLVILDMLFHNHFPFPITFNKSILVIASLTNQKQFTLFCKQFTVNKDTVITYTSHHVIPTGKYKLISSSYTINKLEFTHLYKDSSSIEIPPITSAFNVSFYEYFSHRKIQLGIHIDGPPSDILNGTFNLHIKQDSSPVLMESCYINDKPCTIDTNGTIFLPELSNTSSFNLCCNNITVTKTSTINCIFSFDDAIGKNHVCSVEEIYIYRQPIELQINKVNKCSQLQIINPSNYAMLVHHCQGSIKQSKFTILPSEVYNMYYSTPMTLVLEFSFIDSFIFQKMLNILEIKGNLPNALRHELKTQFMLTVDFIAIAERAFIEFKDLKPMIQALPDQFKKHSDIETILKDFKCLLLTNDLENVAFPCHMEEMIELANEPTLFTIQMVPTLLEMTVLGTLDLLVTISTTAETYIAELERRNEWILEGFCKKQLNGSSALKIKLQACKVGWLLLPDCHIHYNDKSLLIKPSKGLLIKVVPEPQTGLLYF